MITLNKEQIDKGEYKRYDPARYECIWNKDYTSVTIVPLTWWDDASYARYQGDGNNE